MANTVQKYLLEIPSKGGLTGFRTHEGAKILRLAPDRDGRPAMWVLTNPERKLERRTFVAVWSGVIVPDGFDVYHGTIVSQDMFFHVFEGPTTAIRDPKSTVRALVCPREGCGKANPATAELCGNCGGAL